MKRRSRRAALPLTAVLMIVLPGVLSCEARAEPTAGSRAFFDQSPWHDGRAEVNFYDAVELRYGEPRQADEAVLIFVKEDHVSDRHVKADDPAEGDLPAVKLNWVTEIPTGIYTYRQQASVFINRETNRPFRETFASHEWCGNVYKDLRQTSPDVWRYEWSTYFEEDGEGSRRIETPAAAGSADSDAGKGDGATSRENGGGGGAVMLADAMPLYVRTVDANHTVRVLPSLRTIRAEAEAFDEPIEASIRLGREHTIRVPAGTFAVQRVEVRYEDGREDLYLLEAGPRRRLIKMQLADGSVYQLRRSLRVDYWNRNAPEDTSLRQGDGVR